VPAAVLAAEEVTATPFFVALCRLQRHNVTRFLASRAVAALGPEGRSRMLTGRETPTCCAW